MSAATPRTQTTTAPPRRRRKSGSGNADRRRGTKPVKLDRDASPHVLCEQDRSYAFAVAMKYVKDEEAAADIAQEALLLAHRHRHSFRGDSRYSTWLYRIAATTSLMYLRKKKRRSREVLVAPTADAENSTPFEKPSPRSTPEERGAARECMEIVRRRLAELGDKYHDIFWLRFYEGYTESEIAKRLDLNVATVKTRAYRARLAIRETLREAMQQPVATA